MLFRLLLLFTIVPLVELALLVWIGEHIGLGPTLLIVFATGAVGATLARHEGLRCWQQVHEELAAGRLPGNPLIDALMILVAGALLVTPGVLTDLVGFTLLIPPCRRAIRNYLKRRFADRLHVTSTMSGWPPGADQPGHDKIIDTRVIDAPSQEIDPPQ